MINKEKQVKDNQNERKWKIQRKNKPKETGKKKQRNKTQIKTYQESPSPPP